eukprot:COSAG06_NODE_9202_length_1960_cov_0.943041_1_plen_629_part_10
MDAGEGGHGKVVSMADNNKLFFNGVNVATLNKGERWTGSVNDFDEFSASGPIYGSVRAGGEHVMASGRLKGRTFSFGNDRRAALGLWARAMDADASCTITTNAGVMETRSIPAGTGHHFAFSAQVGSDEGVSVVCSADIVLSTGGTAEMDYMAVAPEAMEWYGIASTTLSLSQSGTDALDVIESCSDGSSRTLTIPGTGTGSWSGSGYPAHYTGKACILSATAPFGAHSLADGDGADAVNFLPTSTGSMVFGASTPFEWMAFASLEAGTCTCSHGTVEVNDCNNGVCKGILLVAGDAGATCDCTVPMFGVLECSQTNDEQLFYGDLAYESAVTGLTEGLGISSSDESDGTDCYSKVDVVGQTPHGNCDGLPGGSDALEYVLYAAVEYGQTIHVRSISDTHIELRAGAVCPGDVSIFACRQMETTSTDELAWTNDDDSTTVWIVMRSMSERFEFEWEISPVEHAYGWDQAASSICFSTSHASFELTQPASSIQIRHRSGLFYCGSGSSGRWGCSAPSQLSTIVKHQLSANQVGIDDSTVAPPAQQLDSQSCAHILHGYPDATTSEYQLQPGSASGVEPFHVHCNMDMYAPGGTAGGWALVATRDNNHHTVEKSIGVVQPNIRGEAIAAPK